MAVKQNGKMYSWGIGMCGQLGHSLDTLNEMQKKYLGLGGGPSGAQGNRKMELSGTLAGVTKEMGPQRFDYDEDYAINPAHILD